MMAAFQRDNFNYESAFSRNIGWVSEREQQVLREKTIAIAGMGGVGGVHLTTFARLGIENFRIADFDVFEIQNFNRQVGATLSTIGRPKAEVLAEMVRDINSDAKIEVFADGLRDDNLVQFLEGADIFVDAFDFFVLDMRARAFARARELGIPAITAAPLGMGTAYIVFTPDGMSFEDYFRIGGKPELEQYVRFYSGLAPEYLQQAYLVDPARLDLQRKFGPSTIMGVQLASGVLVSEGLKLLLGRDGVKAAPWHHHFDAYRNLYRSGRLRGGNANPVQRLKIGLTMRRFARHADHPAVPPAEPRPGVMERVLDRARWAPSGDNSQPWRFEIRSDAQVRVHVRDQSDHDLYDYDGGQPTLLSAGMLMENLRLAALAEGRETRWRHLDSAATDHRFEVDLLPGNAAYDPLERFIELRSVDRHPYRRIPLTNSQKLALEASLGNKMSIRWMESDNERWHMAKLSGAATDIRLRIPEAYRIHKAVIDWTRGNSSTGMPSGALGMDPVTLKAMHWAMQDWSRLESFNRLLGTFGARIQLDYVPVMRSAAYLTITRRRPPASPAQRVSHLIELGMGLQRFWLEATRQGLVFQPGMAIIIFGCYARQGVAFTENVRIRAKAAAIERQLAALCGDNPDDLIFLGRIGQPASPSLRPRSIRRPLDDLLTDRSRT